METSAAASLVSPLREREEYWRTVSSPTPHTVIIAYKEFRID